MNLLNKIFGEREKALESFAFLGSDMHSHLVPGIDDGAPDVATAVALVQELHSMGYTHLITTPHVMADLYPNTSENIRAGLAELRAALQAANLNVTIAAAAEYLMDEAFGEKIETEELLTLPDRQILVEMSFIAAPPQLRDYLFRLQMAGYRPILAHPERYEFYRGDRQAYEELVAMGCQLQLNLLSLTGYYGRSVKQTAVKLLQAGMVTYLGTDLHHLRHAEQLRALLQDRKISRLLADYTFANHTLTP